MCGPSNSEKALAGQSASLSSTLAADFGQRFGQQSGVLQNLNQSLSPIVAAGPGQAGWSPQEAAAISTAAINNAGAAARNATQATQGALAGRGGDSGLESGVDQQIIAGVKSNAANALAGQQTQNTVADYNQGNQNYWKAAGGLNALGNAYNPESFGSEATSSNANAFGQAKTITDQTNAEQQAIAGGITGLAGTVLTGGLSGLAGSAAGANQPLSFLTGALSGGKG